MKFHPTNYANGRMKKLLAIHQKANNQNRMIGADWETHGLQALHAGRRVYDMLVIGALRCEPVMRRVWPAAQRHQAPGFPD